MSFLVLGLGSKWKPGEDHPESWFDFYRLNPCVPVDYYCIHTALAVATESYSSRRRVVPKQQVRSIRVLLRPGNHILKHAIEVRAVSGAKVEIQTMETPPIVYDSQRNVVRAHNSHDRPTLGKASNAQKKGVGKLRILLSCVRPDVSEQSETEESYVSHSSDNSESMAEPPKRATLIFKSRRQNEPVFRVQQGLLQLNNVEIQHYSHGTDIWNGNAAVQIQPLLGENNAPILLGPRPVAILENVQILSRSGRGIVNIDGGNLVVRYSVVRDCAATGIYIGGPGSEAIIHHTDVIRNGVGNRTRRGVVRGHSGIYLEQGITRIDDCNISNNTLTGISVVSQDNAFLTLENSDVISNGTYQLELPTLGTISRRSSHIRSSRLSVNGDTRNRSGLTIPDSQPVLEGVFSI
jgi:Right handed beta helix region